MQVACLDIGFVDKTPGQVQLEELTSRGLGIPSAADRMGKVQFRNGLSASEFQQKLCELFPRLITGKYSLCQATKGRVLQFIPNWRVLTAENMKRVLQQGRLYIVPSALRPATSVLLQQPPFVTPADTLSFDSAEDSAS